MRTLYYTSSRWFAFTRPFIPWIVALVNSLLILHLTLTPYRFQFATVLSHDSVGGLILRFLNGPSDPNDIINNIILFLPLGFSLAWLVQRPGSKGLLAAIIPLIIGGGLSVLVELLQLFLPTRTSTPIDVLTNSFGALLGLLIFHSIRLVLRSSTALMTALIGWLILAFAVSIPMQAGAKLTNWDPTFPLLIGNEASGGQSWSGRIFDVAIADTALTDRQVQAFIKRGATAPEFDQIFLASYQFTGSGSYTDRTGTLPNLAWVSGAPGAPAASGILLVHNRWVETQAAAAPLTQRIARTGQFTLITTAASADSEQEAAIISLSGDSARRNFTLGQEQDHLTFYLRTPTTGESAWHIPELFVPGVFADTRPHQVIVTYDRGTFQFYIDGVRQPHAQVITPEYTFFGYLLPPQIASWMQHKLLNPDERYVVLYELLYASLLFVPLGLLLAIAMKRLPSRLNARLHGVLLLCGLIIPSVLLEAERVLAGEQAIQWPNLMMSLMLTLCAWAFFRMRRVAWEGGVRGRSPVSARPNTFSPEMTSPTMPE